MSTAIGINDFPRAFDMEVLPSASVADNPIYFTAARSFRADEPEAAAVAVRVSPAHAKPWDGVFAPLMPGHYVSGIYAHPDPFVFVVVANGQGYIVNAHDPEQWAVATPSPIMAVVPVPNPPLLVLVGSTYLTALDESGEAWTTPELSYDGIEVTRLEDQTLYGYAWSAPREQKVEFAVDLQTGSVEGGADPL
jgi:hypothetical protein